MEEVGAVRLEVQPLARGVRGDQDAQRIPVRRLLEPSLDLLAARSARQPVDDLDAFAGAVGALDRASQRPHQEAFRAHHVLGEDEHPAVVPPGGLSDHRRPEVRQLRAHVLADPADQAPRLGVRPRAGVVGHLAHPIQQAQLLPPERLGRGVAFDLRLGVAVGRLDLELLPLGIGGLGLLGELALLVGPDDGVHVPRRVVVRAGGREKPQPAGLPAVRLGDFRGCGARPGTGPPPHPLLPVPLHRLPMSFQTHGERLDRREQTLLQPHHQEPGGRPATGCRGRETPVAQGPVVVEQARQDQLGRVLRQPVDHHRHHDALGKPAHLLADVLLEAPHHHGFQILPAAHPDAPREAVRIEQLQQRREAVRVSVVGRGGKEKAVLEAVAEITHRAGELRLDPVAAPVAGRGVVRLVEDQQAAWPHRSEPRAHRVGVGGVGEQPVRDQEAAVGGPRVGAEAPFAPDAGQVPAVQNLEDEPEALLHLPLPLLEHRRGRGHHDGTHLPPQQQLAHDQSRFDGLPQSRVVGDEEVDPGEQQRLPQRLHLVGVDLDPGPERRLEERRVGGGGAAPPQRVQEGGEVIGRVEAPLPEIGPRLVVQDGAGEFILPEDFEFLALGVVVRAGEADAGGLAGFGGRDDLFDQPVAGADAHHFADARVALGEVGVEGGGGGRLQCAWGWSLGEKWPSVRQSPGQRSDSRSGRRMTWPQYRKQGGGGTGGSFYAHDVCYSLLIGMYALHYRYPSGGRHDSGFGARCSYPAGRLACRAVRYQGFLDH